MNGFIAAQLLLQLAVPLVLIGRLARAGGRDRLGWALDTALATSYVVAISLGAPWLALPRWLVLVHGALIASAAAVSHGRLPRGHRARTAGRAVAARSVSAAATVACVALSALALAGRRSFDEPTMDLLFPLANGTYLVASGGSNTLLNPHLKTRTGARFRPYRGQTYAVDIVKLGRWGSRASSPVPADANGYAVFGEPIHAPCSGRVVRSVDGHPDNPAAPVRPPELEGNHVIVACDRAWVVLAHMQRGSVRVATGDLAVPGQVIGRVGNSGRSDEPHLHIHAQHPGTEAEPMSGRPIPITFEGRHLVRSDRVHEGPAPTDSGRARANPLVPLSTTTSEDG